MDSTVDAFPQVSMASASRCGVIHNVSDKISTVPPHGVEGNQDLPVFSLPRVKKCKQQLQVQKV